jgi:DNA repair protein RecO (recombination protein O)
MCALLSFTLPEREPHPLLYRRSLALFDLLGENAAWPVVYLRWELALLEEMGFGLDLATCAVTGSREDLVYVSPKTGRAVSAEGAGEWADRLLPLPQILLGQGSGPTAEVLEGLRTTGHFLTHWLAPALGDRPLPAARERLIDAFARA